MSKLHCCLCDELVNTTAFNIQRTCTLHSNTLLYVFLQNTASTVNEQINLIHHDVCEACYNLINELDSVKVRAEFIENQLKQYFIIRNNKQKRDKKNEEISSSFSDTLSTIIEEDEHITESRYEEHELKTKETNNIQQENVNVNLNYALGKCRCTQCDKTFNCTSELKKHEVVSHGNERRFICEICGQAYKKQKALTIHVGLHSGVSPFMCPHCNKPFTQKGALNRHLPIHTGELKYQCDLCGKRYVHHTSFNVHKLSHTGQKPYKCSVCGLLLISGSHLKRHMKVHTGEKKHECAKCGRKFAEKYNLGVHEKLHRCTSQKNTYEQLNKMG